MKENNTSLKIAVVGAGVSGLGAAWLLSQKHDVTVFEADDHFGGHANTVTVLEDDSTVDIDTGFIVCNNKNYPTFLALMDHLSVPYVPADMSFGVSIGAGDFEYAGADSLAPMFAQKRNILRPRFWSMLLSLLRFYRETSVLNVDQLSGLTLRDFLIEGGYSAAFIRDHILPMAAAVWSTPSDQVGDFPLKNFLRFCQNHGLLQVNNRPQWYTINGGSQNYVKALINATQADFHVATAISAIRRGADHVMVSFANGRQERFDRIIIATHADTALQLLKDADAEERQILGDFSYQENVAVLHSDDRLMPKRHAVWSSWNYTQDQIDDLSHLSVTYWMNALQPLATQTNYFVTLNPSRDIADDKIHYQKTYHHPIFNLSTLRAQKDIHRIMGRGGIWYAGAHMGYGFHEDGMQSGLYAAELAGDMRRPAYMPSVTDRIIGAEQGLEVIQAMPAMHQAAE